MHIVVRLLLVCLLSAVVVFAPTTYRPVEAQSGWTLYDNFNALLIDATKWVGYVDFAPDFPPPLGANEMFRGILFGRLVMYQRLNGNPAAESENFQATILRFRNPDPIKAIQVQLKVTDVEMRACASNPFEAGVRAALVGVWFNAGTPVPGNSIDDVIARIVVQAFTTGTGLPDNVLYIRGQVRRCTNANCLTSEALPNVDLGTVTVGRMTTLSIRWDEANGRFLFKRDAYPAMQVIYPWADDATPANPRKELRVQGDAPNCPVGRTVSFISASFDNVYVSR